MTATGNSTNAPQAGPGMRGARNPRGLTILEILLLLAVGAFVVLTWPNFRRGNGTARITAAQADIHGSLRSALGRFKLDTGSYPKSLQDLTIQPVAAPIRRRPYLNEIPVDPWGNPYIYNFPGNHGADSYDLASLGPDGQAGTDDDIVSWK